ncbi:hypothetical protein THAOC_01794, partial [Thalassiosira oceanica]
GFNAFLDETPSIAHEDESEKVSSHKKATKKTRTRVPKKLLSNGVGSESEDGSEDESYESVYQKYRLNLEDEVQYARDGSHPVYQSTIRTIDPTRSSLVLSDNTELNATDRVLLVKKRVYLQVDEYDLNTESSLPPSSKKRRVESKRTTTRKSGRTVKKRTIYGD